MSSERAPRFDLEAIKHALDLAEFVQRYTTLTCISRQGEYAGPCPSCGGEDRFHVKGERFFCRQCYPRGGDIIDFICWRHGVTFVEACRQLQADAFLPDRPASGPRHRTAVEHTTTPAVPDAQFQLSAWRTIQATQRRLLVEPQNEGQHYLQARALTSATWQRYQLGYGESYHPRRRQNMPAILIPWLSRDGRTVLAIQHRFFDPTLSHAERYTMKAGSTPTLFGLHLLQPAQQIVVVEGEFNCMAIQQCGVAALSIGSETNVRKPDVLTQLQTLCTGYPTVAIWLDNPARTKQLVADLSQSGGPPPDALRLVVQAHDANELLVAGELAGVLRNVLDDRA